METTRTMKLALNKEWAVGARIGGGGFGAVFEAENTAGEKAAVKLVPKAPGTEREMLFINLDDPSCMPERNPQGSWRQ